jgi:hypothetical protein
VDPASEFDSPYIGIGDNPECAIDPDGGDIIYLNSSDAVHGFGHAAVLIGNDKKGWRYLSMNGTAKKGENGKMYGKSVYPDLGNVKMQNDFRGTGKTANEVINIVNTSNKKIDAHNYNRAIRIKTSESEDEIAYQAARKQASMINYNIFGSSCIDVPQQAFAAVILKRLGNSGDSGYNSFKFMDKGRYGFEELIPNDWFNNFGDFMESINIGVMIENIGQIFEYQNVSQSPRDF